jgi:hypothetical protein
MDRRSTFHLVYLLVSLILTGPPLMARAKTDIVVMNNGDTITGEIKQLVRGKLSLSTDYMSTVEIEWEKVEEIRSEYFFEFQMDDGQRYYGYVEPAQDNQSAISGIYRSVTATNISIVGITPIEEGFLDRLKLSADFGFNLTKSQKQTQYTLNVDSRYRVEKYEATANLSSLFNSREESPVTKRHDLTLQFLRFLPKRWYVGALSRFNHNEEIALDLRSTAGGLVGRALILNNHLVLAAFGGATATRERFFEQAPTWAGEALTGTRFETFRFRRPEMDLVVNFFLIPSLTVSGRVRSEFDSKLRIELIKDLYWSFSFYHQYDSKPASPDTPKDDYGLVTSVGYKF